MRSPLVVWQFTDGKPGHESQARGLIAALRRRTDVHAYPIAVADCRCGMRSLLWRRHPCQTDFPPPDLILACGRTTHFAALAARRACGGRLVSLMKPPLPSRLYDLCFVPEHDGIRAAATVVTTRGVLNPIAALPMTRERTGRGVFLIGGPSSHHGWAAEPLIGQIAAVLERNGSRRWTLTTSRRTPAGFVDAVIRRLPSSVLDRVGVVPAEQTRPGWVADRLGECDLAVVTEDSVSMVYESLTAGVAVALLAMPRRGRSRVTSGVDRLLREGAVSPVGAFLKSGDLSPPERCLAEADRCAELVLSRWFRSLVRAA